MIFPSIYLRIQFLQFYIITFYIDFISWSFRKKEKRKKENGKRIQLESEKNDEQVLNKEKLKTHLLQY